MQLDRERLAFCAFHAPLNPSGTSEGPCLATPLRKSGKTAAFGIRTIVPDIVRYKSGQSTTILIRKHLKKIIFTRSKRDPWSLVIAS